MKKIILAVILAVVGVAAALPASANGREFVIGEGEVPVSGTYTAPPAPRQQTVQTAPRSLEPVIGVEVSFVGAEADNISATSKAQLARLAASTVVRGLGDRGIQAVDLVALNGRGRQLATANYSGQFDRGSMPRYGAMQAPNVILTLQLMFSRDKIEERGQTSGKTGGGLISLFSKKARKRSYDYRDESRNIQERVYLMVDPIATSVELGPALPWGLQPVTASQSKELLDRETNRGGSYYGGYNRERQVSSLSQPLLLATEATRIACMKILAQFNGGVPALNLPEADGGPVVLKPGQIGLRNAVLSPETIVIPDVPVDMVEAGDVILVPFYSQPNNRSGHVEAVVIAVRGTTVTAKFPSRMPAGVEVLTYQVGTLSPR